MTVWLIEPRDSLIVRDGRPFGPNPGARARSLPFPFPSTTTGALRALWWTHTGRIFTGQRLAEEDKAALLRIDAKGPLLVEMSDQREQIEWLFPAPADALLLRAEAPSTTGIHLHRLVPLAMPTGAVTDLEPTLYPVGLPKPNRSKPANDVPGYWRWTYLQSWLATPEQLQGRHPDLYPEDRLCIDKLGSKGPTAESRTHLRVQPESQTADEGFLFQTSGLEFQRMATVATGAATLTGIKRLALAVSTDAELPAGTAFLGGERRAAQWRKTNLALPPCPSEIRAQIIQQKHCRLMLLTPAYFERGDRPKWLLDCTPEVKATVRALAVQRPQVVSGWDYDTNRPKATNRLAPPGSIYFLHLESSNPEAIDRFIDTIWMQCVSDEDQMRRDGFGMAIMGTWDGHAQPMQEESQG